MEKLNTAALSLSIGILCAVYMLFLGLAAMFGWGTAMVGAISSLYLGYAPSLAGSVIGAIWGFVDGAVAGAIIAWVYNAVSKKK